MAWPTTSSRGFNPRQTGGKKAVAPFAREVAEMVRYAVGYQSRAFVTSGADQPRRSIRNHVGGHDVATNARDHRTTLQRASSAVLAAALKPSSQSAS